MTALASSLENRPVTKRKVLVRVYVCLNAISPMMWKLGENLGSGEGVAVCRPQRKR